jgi:spore coat polysaccharide biosynthesis predicted glycosyltransferase SpsG
MDSCNILISILEYTYRLAKNKNCTLILDSYGVHEDEKIREIAKKLKINLIYVPPGRTAFNQPLDVSVNGVIKAISGKLIR